MKGNRPMTARDSDRECRKRLERLEQALKVIHTWTDYELAAPAYGLKLIGMIRDKAEEALK